MGCGIWCGVKYAVLLNDVGVVCNSCECGIARDVDCGCVLWNMCFEMWWREMVVPRQTAVEGDLRY